ncbi:uncharacterized protein TNCV_3999001 [Trichonephila clavipes]|nr:uncharacterized protein TNCV_3999001 [Trichonephila clavipes]
MYTTTEITVCPFSNKHPASLMSPNIVTNGFSHALECLMATTVGLRPYSFDWIPMRSCQVIYSQFGLAIHQNDHQARRRFVEWAQNEIAVVPDFHKRILFIDEAHFWLNGYVNKQNCRICSEANPQVYVGNTVTSRKTDCLVRFMGCLVKSKDSSKTMKATTLQSMVIGIEP